MESQPSPLHHLRTISGSCSASPQAISGGLSCSTFCPAQTGTALISQALPAHGPVLWGQANRVLVGCPSCSPASLKHQKEAILEAFSYPYPTPPTPDPLPGHACVREKENPGQAFASQDLGSIPGIARISLPQHLCPWRDLCAVVGPWGGQA